MSETTLDAAEAARLTLAESLNLNRALLRATPAAEALERAAARFASGLVADHTPDGHELLRRYGAAAETLEAAEAAMRGVEDALKSLCFRFQDVAEPSARLRARALAELRAELDRRSAQRRD